MTAKEACAIAASELNIPYRKVWEAYKIYWLYVKEYMGSLPLKEDLSTEELKKLRTTISVPYLGKFYVSFKKRRNKRKRYERYCYKRDSANLHNDSDNS